MPLFMDVHDVEGGVPAAEVAGGQGAGLAAQGAHGVNYLRYWVDGEAGKIFCLVEAPGAEAANTVRQLADGLVADEIYPVTGHGQSLLQTGRRTAVALTGGLWGAFSRTAGRAGAGTVAALSLVSLCPMPGPAASPRAARPGRAGRAGSRDDL